MSDLRTALGIARPARPSRFHAHRRRRSHTEQTAYLSTAANRDDAPRPREGWSMPMRRNVSGKTEHRDWPRSLALWRNLPAEAFEPELQDEVLSCIRQMVS